MLAIRAAGLFDGSSQTAVQRPVVLLDAGKIVSIQPHGEPPSHTEAVDLARPG